MCWARPAERSRRMSIHAARVDGGLNVNIGRYEINVRNSRFGSFAEVRNQSGNLVERIFDGQSERLPGGTMVSFDSNRRGQEITVTDPNDRDCRPDRSDRDCRPDRSDRDCRTERSDRDCRPERSDRDCRTERSDRDCRPERSDRHCRPDRGFDVNERNNTIDTGRYLISASGDDQGELRVYDKYTGQWVRAWGDPHLETSDGDTGDFSKRFTLNLEDGTKITVIPTDENNPHLAKAVISKDGHAAEIRYDKNHSPTTEELRGWEARSADRRTRDGTDVYTIGGNLDDLEFGGRRGEEFEGKRVDIDDLAYCSDKFRRTCDPYRS